MARILIVEDNRANMKLATLLLGSAGHSVLCAVDAESGLTLARTEQPDLVLMDIQLPGMDGLAATALLKGDPATAAIPVIALTALAMKADEERTRIAGCDAYIAKPLRYQELYAAIDSLLEKGAGPDATPGTTADPARGGALPWAGHAATAPQPACGAPSAGGPVILVVEDNETNQKVILRQLALLGHAAHVAGNGREGLERWRRGGYALVLSDLQMPEMDGHDLIEAIRAEEGDGHRIPIVVMSASSSREYARRHLTPDMDACLGKPLQLAELQATLAAWLPAPTAATPLGDAPMGGDAGARAGDGPVDIRVLESLVGSDPAVLLGFLDDFQASTGRLVPGLAGACAAHQPQQAGLCAHNLMSSARTIGAEALGELCERMDTAGRAGDSVALATLLPQLQRELAAVDAFIGAWRLRGAGADVAD
jgi:CheY-like chemotaxis protein/HPt (histidine-containing phosphotransfer) domain-containing protein